MTPQQLFNENLNLAYKIALSGKFYCPAWTIEDLKQECLVGLWQAALSFKPELGYCFSTYSYTCITNNLIRTIRSSLMIKGPTHNIAEDLCDIAADDALDTSVASHETEAIARVDASKILDRMKPERAKLLADYYGNETELKELIKTNGVSKQATQIRITVALNAGRIAAMGYEDVSGRAGRKNGKTAERTKEKIEKMKQMTAEGMSSKEITEITGWSRPTLSRYRKMIRHEEDVLGQ